MSQDRLRFRAPSSLIEAVETVAEEESLSKSETCRDLLRRGLADLGADGLDYLAKESLREQIIEEELPRKRQAWFRSNVRTRLLTCMSKGLTPEEAEKDLKSYHREAMELHEDADLAEYVTEGLRIYQQAYPNRKAVLSEWVKSAEPDDPPEDVDRTDHGATEVIERGDADADAERSRTSLSEAADVWASHVRTGLIDGPDAITDEDVSHVDATADEVRQAVRDRLDAEGGGDGDDE